LPEILYQHGLLVKKAHQDDSNTINKGHI
jgi:hypothetical protein